ncbi:MAG: hypothetical protein WBV82_33555 [Myxococcaceae bacterium]
MDLRIPGLSDVKKVVANTVKGVKDTVVDKAKDVKNAVVDTTSDSFEAVKHNPVTDTIKKAVTDPKDLARDTVQGTFRLAYQGVNKLLPDGAADLFLKGAETGVDIMAKGSELVFGKGSSLTDSLKTLGRVDLEGATRMTDPVTGQKLKADWPGLWGTWLLEKRPQHLGTWDKNSEGIDRVTIRDNEYTEDLAGRPHQQKVTEEFFKMYPNPKPGDVFPPPGASDEVMDKALYRFTGPGTDEASPEKYTALEWFIGSYRTQVTCVGIDEKTGKPNLQYEVVNLSHFESGTRVPASFQEKGLPPALVDNRGRESGLGLGGSFEQRYVWTGKAVNNPNAHMTS